MHARNLSVLLALTLIFSIIPVHVSADTVIRSETVDLLPAGTFEDPSDWDLSTNKAYSDDSAEYSQSMVADNRLSFTHNRPANFNEITSWATVSPSGDNLSIGSPDCFKPTSDPVCDNDLDGDSDGGYSWSKGPIIELSGFDMSQGSNYEIANVSLSVAFRVPGALQQDSVQFIVESEGTQHLVRTYAHTMGELNHMNYNAQVYSLDDIKNWTWSELSSLTIKLDYVSVGEFDDTELQVDAAGLIVKHMQPWGTFELAEASHLVSFDEFPVIDVNLTTGSPSDISITPCGLENSGQSSGSWVSSEISLPHGQTWGRFHPSVTGNASWQYSTSEDGTDWSTPDTISAGELIPTTVQHIRFHTTLLDGCIQSLKVDINDPTLTIEGEIIGDVHSMVADFAKLRVAMNGEEVASHAITGSNSTFSLTAAIGHLLTPGGGDIEIGLSARFHWSSDGTSEDIVIHVESMDIEGGFLIEWDRDPVCDGQMDQVFEEDGGGRLLDFLYTCSDDITTNENLVVSVTSSDNSVLETNFVNGQVRLQPMADAHGQVTATITVMDERQNSWMDEFEVIITAVDDSPEMNSLPVELTMELDEPTSIPFTYWDIDTPSNMLDVQIEPSWAIFSGGEITLEPNVIGTHIVTVSITDGATVIGQNVSVIVTQRADVWVQSVDLLDMVWRPISDTGDTTVAEGENIAIYVYVRNDGNSIAQPVTVRCSVNGQNIGSPQIAMISPGGLETAICNEWHRLDTQSGEVTLEIEVDWTDDVDETNEGNNLWSTTITIQGHTDSSSNSGDQESSSFLNEYNSMMWVLVVALGLIALLTFMYGPNQIRKIE